MSKHKISTSKVGSRSSQPTILISTRHFFATISTVSELEIYHTEDIAFATRQKTYFHAKIMFNNSDLFFRLDLLNGRYIERDCGTKRMGI